MSANGGKRTLTDEDLARIEELARKGFTSGRIAQILGKRAATVAWAMYAAGLKAPKPAPEVGKTYMRKGVTVRQYSAEEDAFIQAVRIQGYPLSKIAELASERFGTSRTQHSIRVRLTMLANREDVA